MSYQVYKEYLSAYYEELNENRTYVVAFFSQHTGTLTQSLVHARSKLEAVNSVLNTSLHSDEEVEGYCAASDCWVHALQINNTLTE
jgi:hypothetical protein